ncbi:MAG: chromosomal replication initiator protein DnaA, partial [Glaciihabitans sp.]|nr:chromosomal replication initiator protein DnaA [Glaciihabitans sp.]
MADVPDSTREIWNAVLSQLTVDDRITPQLHGFVSLVEPKGIMAGTLYLEVPNELTRGMLEQRIRLPLLNAISGLGDTSEVNNFAIVVNPEIQPDVLERTETVEEQPYIETAVVPAQQDASSSTRRS